MRLETNMPDRKLLAMAISEWVHEQVHYNGAPSMSYSIGPVRVERDAAITCDDADAWAMLQPFFAGHNWVPTEENEAEQEENEPEDIRCTSVSIPAVEFTVQSAANLLRMLYARQDLLNAMMRGDTISVDAEVMDLLADSMPESMDALIALLDSETAAGMLRGIGFADGRLVIDFPFDEARPTDWQYYAALMFALADRSKIAHRVSTKRIEAEDTEMKYFCNSLLNQLGFGGAEHKALRNALLGHLDGYAAFRTADKMKAHKARFTERRRALRQSKEVHDEED